MEDEEPKSVCPPREENIGKPFFAYGIFKPGQIAFSKINRRVCKSEPHDIHREMHFRDGVPIIKNIESRRITKGYKLYFNKEDYEDAYDIISQTEPFQLYEWDIIEVDGEECNILIGKDFELGSHLAIDDNEKYINNYDGRKDPYFDELICFLKSEIKDGDYWGKHSFHKLQMRYMLLWSAIDRYCSLKYGAYFNQWELRSKLANDNAFKDSLQDCWNQKKIKPKQSVYSTFLVKYDLTRNPWYAINYYYTIRCNVVHRGKTKKIEEGILKQSLKELLAIFEGVIDNTFPKNETIDE